MKFGVLALGYAEKFAGDPCVAMNLLAEAASAVSGAVHAKEAAKVPPVRDLRAYLYRAYLRRIATERRGETCGQFSDEYELIPNEALDVEARVETKLRLKQILGMCDRKTRAIIWARMEGRSWEEIAYDLAMSNHAARLYCSKALGAIAEDGIRLRRQRSVVLGSVQELGVRDARRLLSLRLAAINQSTHKPELMMTFERFVVERWEPNILPILRHSTARNYRHMIRRHLTPFFGDWRLPEIGPVAVQKFLAEKSKQFAPWTIHQLRSILSKIFSTAQRWEYLEKNPTRQVQVPSLTNTREKTTLTPEQVRALLEELEEPYRTMVLLAVLSGLRRGEIFGLRWKYVDFEEGSVTVAECSYEGHTSAPKTRASRI